MGTYDPKETLQPVSLAQPNEGNPIRYVKKIYILYWSYLERNWQKSSYRLYLLVFELVRMLHYENMLSLFFYALSSTFLIA